MTRTISRIALPSLAVAALLPAALHAQDKPTIAPTNSPWSTSVAVGFSLTHGNSENLLLNGVALAQKKMPKYEISLGLDGAYGETTTEQFVENKNSPGTGEYKDVTERNTGMIHGFGQYNYLFTEKFYGFGRLDALNDSVADVEYRFTASAGAGYYFIKNAKTLLSAEGSPGVVTESVAGVSDTYATIRFAERFEHKFNDAVRIWQSFEYLPQIDDFNNYIINAEIGIGATMTKHLELRAYVQDSYDNVPAPGRKQNDIKLVTAVAYKF